MTEAEWLVSTNPQSMLRFLRGKATDRKLRLFACGWSRYVWAGLTLERIRRAVEIAERYADGKATGDELAAARSKAIDAFWSYRRNQGLLRPPARDGPPEREWVLNLAAQCADTRPFHQGRIKGIRHFPELASVGAAFLQCVFGRLPFHPVTADPRWLTSTAVGLARAIYEERAFDRLPILADALEDAGCDNPDLLAHLRGDGPHVRGCWAVDLVLGKQ